MTITRRNLVKGAAWSVPVVAVAVSAPLAAASETTKPCLRLIGSNFNKKELKLKVHNDCKWPVKDVSLSVTWAGQSSPLTVVLGDIPAHGNSEVDHTRLTIPENVSTVHVTVYSGNAESAYGTFVR